MRRHLITAVACGVLITGCTIASAVVLAHIVARVITDPTARTIGQWVWPLSMLLALWTIRTVGHWLRPGSGSAEPAR